MSRLFLVDNILDKTQFTSGGDLLKKSLDALSQLDVKIELPISPSSFLIDEKIVRFNNSHSSFYKMLEDSNINISDCSDSDEEKKKNEICGICRSYGDEHNKLEYSDADRKFICDQCYTKTNQPDKLSSLRMKMSPSHFLNSEDSKMTILSETRNVKPILKFSVSAILGDRTPTDDISKRNGKINVFFIQIIVLLKSLISLFLRFSQIIKKITGVWN